jgi:acyl carrier protein
MQEFLQDKPEIELTDNTKLIDENVLDSLGILLLTSFLQERFGIQIEADEVTLENFETVRALSRLVQWKQEAKQEDAS